MRYVGWTAVYVETKDGRIRGYIAELINATAEAATVEECQKRLKVALRFALLENARENEENFRGLPYLGTAPLDEEPPTRGNA